MQLLLQGEGGRGWGSPNSALWGDHACWKVELAIVMILSTELQLSRNIIIMTNIIFIIIRLSRDIIFMIASRHSLTLAYTNTTIIATTSFPVIWPLFAVRSTMMMTGYLKFKSEKQSQRWLFLRAWRPTQQMSKSRWMTVRYIYLCRSDRIQSSMNWLYSMVCQQMMSCTYFKCDNLGTKCFIGRLQQLATNVRHLLLMLICFRLKKSYNVQNF